MLCDQENAQLLREYLQFSSVKFLQILQSSNYHLHVPSANSTKQPCNPYFFGIQKIPLDKFHVMSKFRKFSPMEMEENWNKNKIYTVN